MAGVPGKTRSCAGCAGDLVSLFLFVSAHGKDGAFHMKGTHLSMAQLRELVEASGARFKLVVVDACESGTITRAKGSGAAVEGPLGRPAATRAER